MNMPADLGAATGLPCTLARSVRQPEWLASVWRWRGHRLYWPGYIRLCTVRSSLGCVRYSERMLRRPILQRQELPYCRRIGVVTATLGAGVYLLAIAAVSRVR